MWQVTVWREIYLRTERVCYWSYVQPTILYESEPWCLRESEMGNLEVQSDPWLEQCVEYSSKMEKGLMS